MPDNESLKPWSPEIKFFMVLAQFIEALQMKMNETAWTLSPAKAYDLTADAIEWAVANKVYGWDNPAWAVVADMFRERASALVGTPIDLMLAQEMTEWKVRSYPSAHNLLMYFDWYMPMFRRATSILGRELRDDDMTATGQPLTIGEAVAVVFDAVDWCSKNHHFRQRTPWGWPQTYPWLDFVRDELKALRDEIGDGSTFAPGQPIGDVPFSYPGG